MLASTSMGTTLTVRRNLSKRQPVKTDAFTVPDTTFTLIAKQISPYLVLRFS